MKDTTLLKLDEITHVFKFLNMWQTTTPRNDQNCDHVSYIKITLNKTFAKNTCIKTLEMPKV